MIWGSPSSLMSVSLKLELMKWPIDWNKLGRGYAWDYNQRPYNKYWYSHFKRLGIRYEVAFDLGRRHLLGLWTLDARGLQ